MKILLIGFLALIGWSAVSTHIYVCKIKGLCDEPLSIKTNAVNKTDVMPADSLIKSSVKEVLVIPGNLIIHFAFDKSEFNSDPGTDKYLAESNAFLYQNQQARLFITGYTDAVGSDEYNQALGYWCAQTVQHYFENKGLLPNKIIIESRGEKEPADDNNTTTGRANNRRTVITIKK